jgi:hypothetical protein
MRTAIFKARLIIRGRCHIVLAHRIPDNKIGPNEASGLSSRILEYLYQYLRPSLDYKPTYLGTRPAPVRDSIQKSASGSRVRYSDDADRRPMWPRTRRSDVF